MTEHPAIRNVIFILFSDYYPSCEIQFMNLANIHAIRKSFHALRALLANAADNHTYVHITQTRISISP